MVTSQNFPQMATGFKYVNPSTFFGLSTDEKPTNVGNGSAFLEMDTSKIYFYDSTNNQWLEWGVDY